MQYDKKILEESLAQLKGRKIVAIYYHNKHDLFQSFTQFAGKVEGVVLGGVVIKTDDNKYYAINDIDFFPHLQLGGMNVKEVDASATGDRKDHFAGSQWQKYADKEITGSHVREIKYTKGENTHILPLGITLTFQDDVALHIYNVFVEDYNAGIRKYDLSTGESLTFFYDTDSLNSYKEVAEGQVVEVEDME